MKTILILVGLLAATLAAPQGDPRDVTITRQEEQNNIGIGGYKFSYELSDGQQREETAELRNEGTENEALYVEGSFSYVGPDGKTYKVKYTAGENGFEPVVEQK